VAVRRADYVRKATKSRCPTGECKPASRWIKADRLHPLIPRETPRWKSLYWAARLSSESSGVYSTGGASLRSASVTWTGSGCTPT
jgi:hypothetical protein